MLKVIKSSHNSTLYRCKQNDTLGSIASQFGILSSDILRDNPLFCGVYDGCVLCIPSSDSTLHIVQPMQNLDDIAKLYSTSKNEIMQYNNLHTEKVFVGMHLYIKKQ